MSDLLNIITRIIRDIAVEPGYIGTTQSIPKADIPKFKKVYLVDVDIESSSGVLKIKLNGPLVGGESKIGMTKIQGAVSETTLIKAIQALLDPAGPRVRFGNTGAPNRYPPKETQMSFHGKDKCFIVFKLTNSNTFFTQEGQAVKIPDVGSSTSPFKWMRRVKSDGALHRADEDFEPGNPLKNERSQMVVVAYDKPTSREHIARLNLQLDVVENLADPDSAYVPIIVDPDVRFPGGNGGG